MSFQKSDARSKIMARLRSVPSHNWHQNWPCEVPEGEVFPPVTDLLGQFKEELLNLGGQVFVGKGKSAICNEVKRLCRVNGWKKIVAVDHQLFDELEQEGICTSNEADFGADFDVGITRCEALISLLGSVMVCASGPSGRRMNVFPPVHIVMAGFSQIVPAIADGFDRVETKYGTQKYSQITLVSGPSRTADIEKTLVMGAHGPRELIVLIDRDA